MTDEATSFIDNVNKCVKLEVKKEKYKDLIEEYFEV